MQTQNAHVDASVSEALNFDGDIDANTNAHANIDA